MLLLPLKLCKPGMRLGRPIFSDDGLVLLNERMELTDPLIKRLAQFGIQFLYVEDSRTDDIVMNDIVSQETRSRAVSEVRTQFRKIMSEETTRKSINAMRLDVSFKSVVNSILDDITSNSDTMMMLVNITASDHYLFQHSVDVCIYSTVLGQAYGYSRDELYNLSLGALLHDIGKTQLPQDVLLKPGRLTPDEFNIVKMHTTLGYQLLKDLPNVPLLSAHVAFQHHERLDGSGYPRAIAGDKIHEYAQWVGIADVYDAMTSHRVYRKAMLPHEAMEMLFIGAGTAFDKNKVELFRDKVSIYPLGMIVKLSTGEIGAVVDINSSTPYRPIVRVLYDVNRQPISPYEVDLSKASSVTITEANVAFEDQSA